MPATPITSTDADVRLEHWSGFWRQSLDPSGNVVRDLLPQLCLLSLLLLLLLLLLVMVVMMMMVTMMADGTSISFVVGCTRLSCHHVERANGTSDDPLQQFVRCEIGDRVINQCLQ